MQVSPEYPFAQVQLNNVTPASTHAAPFLHGSVSQSFMSVQVEVEALNVWYPVAQVPLVQSDLPDPSHSWHDATEAVPLMLLQAVTTSALAKKYPDAASVHAYLVVMVAEQEDVL